MIISEKILRWGMLASAMALSLVGCGYTFQGSANPLLERHGVRRIYVAPLGNTTFKPGVESILYDELVRVIAVNRRVTVVNSVEDADAILNGSVGTANADRSGATGANNLFPPAADYPWVPRVSSGLQVATSYNAVLGGTFTLKKIDKETGAASQELWSGDFLRTKSFPANNQLGALGNTAALINESEFDRALSDAARSMVYDVHESMLAMF